MLMTVDVDVYAWYINHMIKDVKINIHVLFMMFMILKGSLKIITNLRWQIF